MFVKPEVDKNSFHCPICGVLAQQEWAATTWCKVNRFLPDYTCEIKISNCMHCKEGTIWVQDKMIYPDNGGVPEPNYDMPKDVKSIYLEAASIYSKSPRGAAALLRLGIQILCKELGGKGKNIDDDIAYLVKEKGLHEVVQQSLDAVRVIGNQAVHPGQIDTDSAETVMSLFKSVNIITKYTISIPKETLELFMGLPEGKREYINKRDSKS